MDSCKLERRGTQDDTVCKIQKALTCAELNVLVTQDGPIRNLVSLVKVCFNI